MSETIIYSKPSCPYCVRAKEILNEQGVTFREVSYGQPGFENKERLIETIVASVPQAQKGAAKAIATVPQIILNGTFIGGCDKLAAHFGVPVWPNRGQ
jgi:glutaredoxin